MHRVAAARGARSAPRFRTWVLAAVAALVGTLLGQLAGWPRLLADAFRLAIPAVHRRFEWKTQFRFFLLLFFATNMAIVYTMQRNPIGIVQTAAVLDGILLTALQALWVGLGLYVVLPRLLPREAWDVLRPSPVFAVGLAAGFIVFGFLTVTEAIPQILALSRVEPIGEWPLKYVNRLSDLFFVLARWISHQMGEPEYLWQRGLHPKGKRKK